MKKRAELYFSILKNCLKDSTVFRQKNVRENIKSLLPFFILILFSCKGEPVKKEMISTFIHQENLTGGSANQTADNCYDYLTELVRSSNFPFSEWKIHKNKVHLLIDDDNNGIISAKLFYDTEGTGTIGWIEYHKQEGKLFNTSANLDRPIELQYDLKRKGLFDSCLSKKQDQHLSHEDRMKDVHESFVISCGSGCAMTYTPESVTGNFPDIQVKFRVEIYIDEQLTDTYDEVYIFSYDNLNQIKNVHPEGKNENVLETLLPSAQKSFRDFGNRLARKKSKI
ncbi:hypothetical protein [Chryseobacterium gregarium]|uniref:hypothetical protein n=1 Tax=Chryseobacterium gregarium TaxID=456299 RepID=UPI000406C398|nr:hypothetical protein [Chryseobacterium gregarium]